MVSPTALLLVVVSSLLSLSNALNTSLTYNASWFGASSLLPQRTYPGCAYDIHSATNTPLMFYISGETGTNANAPMADGYYSTNGWTSAAGSVYISTNTTSTGATVPVRRAGSAVYLANGNLIELAGKTTGNVLLNAILQSSNNGATWNNVNPTGALWAARSDASICAMPRTNTIFLAAGAGSAGGLNDSWVSTDGMGAVWTQTNFGTSFPAFQSSPCVGLYDSTAVSSQNTQPNSTLIMLTNVATYYITTNMGYTFSSAYSAPWTGRNYLDIAADRDNFVYVLGGQNTNDNNVYFSSDKAQTWSILGFQNNFGLNQYWQEASTTCLAIQVVQQGGVYYKQLTVYGGTIWLGNTTGADTTMFEVIQGTLNTPYRSLAANVSASSSTGGAVVTARSSSSSSAVPAARSSSSSTAVVSTLPSSSSTANPVSPIFVSSSSSPAVQPVTSASSASGGVVVGFSSSSSSSNQPPPVVTNANAAYTQHTLNSHIAVAAVLAMAVLIVW